MEINSDVKNNGIRRLIAYLLSWGLIPMIYLSWCFSTISYKNSLFGYVSGAVAVISALVYFFLICNKDGYADSHEDEIDVLNAVIIIGGVLFLFIIGKEYETGMRWPAVLGTLSWIAVAVIWVVKNPIQGILGGCVEWIKEHIMLLVLMAVVVLLSVDPNMYQFKWDGR
ncbi:MAG: hypothetical protein K5888_07705, partial [Lachnospiraceae bacterium]|nr:hypothetical protein [Lachnospiraceae bacterium]